MPVLNPPENPKFFPVSIVVIVGKTLLNNSTDVSDDPLSTMIIFESLIPLFCMLFMHCSVTKG